ncbi:MAG: hypothetical protein MZV70_39705 [Desulfobacterales bacterium]|nr:hypothetical protein [Desulfobacterales bacterium]
MLAFAWLLLTFTGMYDRLSLMIHGRAALVPGRRPTGGVGGRHRPGTGARCRDRLRHDPARFDARHGHPVLRARRLHGVLAVRILDQPSAHRAPVAAAAAGARRAGAHDLDRIQDPERGGVDQRPGAQPRRGGVFRRPVRGDRCLSRRRKPDAVRGLAVVRQDRAVRAAGAVGPGSQ